MKAADFDYSCAASIPEACRLLAGANGEGRIIAGGQTGNGGHDPIVQAGNRPADPDEHEEHDGDLRHEGDRREEEDCTHQIEPHLRGFARARLAGATPLWQWIGEDTATVFSY